MRTLEPPLSAYATPPARRAWELGELLGGLELRYFSHGRIALAKALQVAGIGSGEVLLPGLICREVPEAMKAQGARILYYPVDERMRPDLERLPGARAILAVNYFGFPQDLSPFRSYAQRAGAVLIEDNAHGLFSRDAAGAWLGTRADLGVFSLRKTLPLPNGAALAARPGRFRLAPQEAFSAPTPASYRLKQALRRTAPLLGHKPLGFLTRGLRGLKRIFNGTASEALLFMKESPSCLLSQPLTVADPGLEVERRRGLYLFAERLVGQAGGRAVFEGLPEGVSPYGFPFYAGPEELVEISRALGREGLECFPWPDLPPELDMVPEHYRLWCVRFLW